jgi:hypothetical protein
MSEVVRMLKVIKVIEVSIRHSVFYYVKSSRFFKINKTSKKDDLKALLIAYS